MFELVRLIPIANLCDSRGERLQVVGRWYTVAMVRGWRKLDSVTWKFELLSDGRVAASYRASTYVVKVQYELHETGLHYVYRCNRKIIMLTLQKFTTHHLEKFRAARLLENNRNLF